MTLCQVKFDPRAEAGGEPVELEVKDQLELLISRIADGEAGDADWAAFSALAAERPAAWRELAQAQRDHAAMSVAVGVALHAAEGVDLPSREAAERFIGRRNAPTHIRTWSRMGAWGGWAVAALVAIAAWGGHLGMQNNTNSTPAGLITVNSPDDAVKAYLKMGAQSGRVVGELPNRLLVDSRPAAEGEGFEVIYIRQFIERRRVDDLLRFGQDEGGRLVPVRVSMPARDGTRE